MPMTLLNDGRALVIGGWYTQVAEVFNPASGTWRQAAPTNDSFSRHTAVRLTDGRVLVAGG